jgi:murein DD-endopeptidase MepM/ murein hydrolase activator NlpD
LLLGGCSSSNGQIRLFNRYTLFGSTPTSVSVQKGDTLYSISKRYDVPLKDLIETNNLRAPYTLNVGQTLRLPTTRYHVVQKGDTLYSISRQYNVDMTTLTQKNRLQPPYTLNVGQKLALSGSLSSSGSSTSTYTAQKTTTATAAKSTVKSTPVQTPVKARKTKFQWPVQGKVISGFGVIGKGRKNDGINISAARGTAVKAADKGTVAYAGNELKGFGNLILIKHSDGWITAYAHNEKLLVKKGQTVLKGEKIATVGSTGGVNAPQLHFEVRAGKKAVNPRQYLP